MKKEKALKILKDYIGTGPEAEPVDFDNAISTAIKAIEKKAYKPYIAEELEKRMMLALKLGREKSEFVVTVFLDDQLLHSIWCDRVSVFATKPPTYCLYAGGINIIGLSAQLMVVNPDAQGIIPEKTLVALGKFVTIGYVRYDNGKLRVEAFKNG